MTSTSQTDTAGGGRRFHEQAAGLMDLLAEMQASLAECVGQGVDAAGFAVLAEQQARLAEATEHLRRAHEELEQQVEVRSAQLTSREAALEASRAELRNLTRRLVQVQEDERRALSRDLHDTSSEAMTVIGLGLAMLQREANCSDKTLGRINQLRDMAATVGEDLHRLSVNLRPTSLDRYGLVPALDELIRALRQRAGIEVEFEAEGLDERLPGEIETALYRVVQEACTNIMRYADAAHAVVRLHRLDRRVRVQVEDDGEGFDVDEALSRGRLGLVGMRERAEMFGGVFGIDSSPGRGTRVWAEVPLPSGSNGSSAAGEDRETLVEVAPAAEAEPSSEAAELARGKALSDALVDIMEKVVREPDAHRLLDDVLAVSAQAIGCDYAYVALREESQWCLLHGFRLPDGMTGRRLPDADLPLSVEAERLGKPVLVSDIQEAAAFAGLAREWGACCGVAVPLRAGEGFIGAASYFHTSASEPFRPSEIDFLGRLAALVSLSLENVQLQEAEAGQRRAAEASAETARQLVTERDAILSAISEVNEQLENANAELHAQAEELGQVNHRLQAERDLLRTLLTNIPDEIWFADRAGNVSAANPAAVRGLNVPSTGEGLQSFPDWQKIEVLTPDGRPRPAVDAPLLRALRGERVDRQDEIIRNPVTGQWRHREATGGAIYDSLSGEISGAVMVVRDITAQKEADAARQQAQAALVESEARYRQLFENIGDSFALVQLLYDETGRPVDYRFLDVNSATAQRAGLSREAMRGKTLRELMPDADVARIEVYADVVRLGRTLRRTGRSNFTDTWYEIYAYSPGPDLIALLGQDVTERRRNEEALRQSEAIYRAVARSFPEGAIYVFDQDLRYRVVDGELLAVLGQTREGLEGKSIWDVFDAETVSVIEPRYRRALAGESLHFETRYGPQFGNRIMAADYRPIRDEGGHVTAGLLVARDLSERSQLVAQLNSHVAELDGILAALPSGLIVYDRNGQVIRLNDQAKQMLGYDEESWRRPVSDRATTAVQLSRPDGSALSREEYPTIRALRGEEVRNESFFIHLPAHPERDFWGVLSASPLRGAQGEQLGAALTMTDVTDLHHARAGLEEANRELRQQADELREAKEGLEQRVQERTAQLGVLVNRVEANRGQLKALSRRLVDMQENERTYVADQLYNQAAQVLAAVRMQMWLVEKHAGEDQSGYMAGMKDALDQAILALHDLAAQLRPASLSRATLSRVLGDYVARYMASNAVAFSFDPGNTADLRVSNEVVTAIFRTIQEAVANILRHAAATEARMSMVLDGGTLVITLADDGVGFDPTRPSNGGVGLLAMRERIESIRGQLTVSSSAGGTTIRIEAPVT